jgi:hypothetical protein
VGKAHGKTGDKPQDQVEEDVGSAEMSECLCGRKDVLFGLGFIDLENFCGIVQDPSSERKRTFA